MGYNEPNYSPRRLGERDARRYFTEMAMALDGSYDFREVHKASAFASLPEGIQESLLRTLSREQIGKAFIGDEFADYFRDAESLQDLNAREAREYVSGFIQQLAACEPHFA